MMSFAIIIDMIVITIWCVDKTISVGEFAIAFAIFANALALLKKGDE